jgi:hypothetical protein
MERLEVDLLTNSVLLSRRLGELRRRREALSRQADRLRLSLPCWALAPLQLAGMTGEEIRSRMSELSLAESEAGLDRLESELEGLDAAIETVENEMLATPARSLDEVQAMLDLALAQARARIPIDPSDVFYDYGEARLLSFLERAAEDLGSLLSMHSRAAG